MKSDVDKMETSFEMLNSFAMGIVPAVRMELENVNVSVSVADASVMRNFLAIGLETVSTC